MAETIPRTTSHVRSASLPSTSPPLDSSIEVLLRRLSTSEIRPTLLAPSICHNLYDIKDLFEGINNSINSPLNQKVISLKQHQNGVEEVLEGSVGLLDACASTIELLSLMKESIVDIESCLRRKNSGEENSISKYLKSRKTIHKMAQKCLKNLQKRSFEKDDDHCVAIVRTLKEAEAASLSTVESILAYFSEPKAKRKGWSLVAKLMHSKSVSCEKQTYANEIEKIDQAIFAPESSKSRIEVKATQELLKQLAALELAIQEIEGCFVSISRCILRTRVSLLNILSH